MSGKGARGFSRAVGHVPKGARGFSRAVGHFPDRKSTRLNSSHSQISYAVFCLKKKSPIDVTICGDSQLPTAFFCRCVTIESLDKIIYVDSACTPSSVTVKYSACDAMSARGAF